MLVICDLQSEHVEHHVIGGNKVVLVRLWSAGLLRAGSELVYRDPEQWLSQRMLDRSYGAPVTVGDLTRVVGNVNSVYVDGSDAYAEARIFDYRLIGVIESYPKGTTFDGSMNYVPRPNTETLEMDDGKTIIIEATPACLNFIDLDISYRN